MLFAFAGTIFYYDRILNDKNSEIASLNNEIANLTTANIEASLKITDFPPNLSPYLPRPIPYSVLDITGSANNTGKATA